MAKHPPLDPRDLPDWPEGDPAAPLEPGVVRAWVWSLESPTDDERLLAPDELARAHRFYFERDRRHFIAARGGLRRLLGRLTGQPAERVAFSYYGLGKPYLKSGVTRPRFNLSHSAGVALAAVCLDQELGADVEAVREIDWSRGLAKRFFAAAEVDALRAAPLHEQRRAFFRIWTSKEAVVKLLGSGLGFPLQSFVTPLGSDAGAVVTLPLDNALKIPCCWVRPLAAGPLLQAAVATAHPIERVECLRLAPS